MDPVSDLIAGGEKLIDDTLGRLFPTPQEKASAQAITIGATMRAMLAQNSQRASIMLAEANSGDKWTSRARPGFLYVMYMMILASIPMGILAAYHPAQAQLIIAGMKAWLAAIPQAMWGTFGVGYAGYLVHHAYTSTKGGQGNA